MGKKYTQEILLLIFTLIILILFNYSFLDESLKSFLEGSSETGIVQRIVDGDTIIVNNKKIRMLGINTPEKGEKYYNKASNFLSNLILNQTVSLEFGTEREDRYGRTLAYIIKNNQNINLLMVEKGYANFYFPSGKDKYYNKFKSAWEECITKNINLCKKSLNICSNCIELKDFDNSNQEFSLYNKCSFSCNLNGWTIKDEGRKQFKFNNFELGSYQNIIIKVGEGIDNSNVLLWRGKKYVWTYSGDSLFLRDKNGDLVLWENY